MLPLRQLAGMTLASYLSTHRLSYREFGRRVGADAAQVHRWASGKRTPSLAQALRIRAETDGAVGVEDFAPAEAA